MTDLPIWARTAQAKELLDLIVAERPTIRVQFGGGPKVSANRSEGYAGKNAAALRRVFNDYSAHLHAVAVEAHKTGTPWAEAEKPLHEHWVSEQPDELIRRMIENDR